MKAKPSSVGAQRLCCFEEAVSIEDRQEQHHDEGEDNKQ
jgi:hypothetical protein